MIALQVIDSMTSASGPCTRAHIPGQGRRLGTGADAPPVGTEPCSILPRLAPGPTMFALALRECSVENFRECTATPTRRRRLSLSGRPKTAGIIQICSQSSC